MSVGMGAFNLDDRKRVQLNSSLKSAEARSAVVTTASKARSSGDITRIIMSRSHASGSVFFTPSMRRPRVSSFSAAVGLSRALNNGRPNYNYVSNLATTGIATQNATYNVGPSKAASFGEALGALAGLITAGAGAAKTLGLGSKLDNAANGLSNSVPSSASEDVAKYINNMKNCKTAGQLKANIEGAKAKLGTIDGNISSLESLLSQGEVANNLEEKVKASAAKADEAKKDAENQKTEVNKLNGQVDQAQKSVEEQDKALAKLDTEYGQAVTNYNNNKTKRKEADTKVANCETAVSNAEADLAKAKTQLLENGEPDLNAIAKAEEALATAKKDLEAARKERDDYKQKEQEALKQKEELATKLASGRDEKATLAKQLQTALNNMNKNEDKLKTMTKQADAAQDNYYKTKEEADDVKAKLDNIGTQSTMLDTAKADRDALAASITEHADKWAKMSKQEGQAVTKEDKKQLANVDKTTSSDYTNSAVINKAMENSSSGKYGGGSWNVLHGNDGSSYYQITNKGQTFYMKKTSSGGQEFITAKEYNERTGSRAKETSENIYQSAG